MTKQEFITEFVARNVTDLGDCRTQYQQKGVLKYYVELAEATYDAINKQESEQENEPNPKANTTPWTMEEAKQWVKVTPVKSHIPEAIIKRANERANARSGVSPEIHDYGKISSLPFLHSAHNKIKRLRKTIKRKAKENTKLSNEFREYMLKGSEVIDLARNQQREAEIKAQNLQWIAEHVEEAVKEATEEKKADLDAHSALYEAQCEGKVVRTVRTSKRAIEGLRTYLGKLSKYIASDNFNKEEAIKKITEASTYLEKEADKILNFKRE